jgi:deoxyribodipyrimidine photo-lyase
VGDIDKYLTESGWREFCRHLLFDVPDLALRNLQPSFDAFPWREEALVAWQRGQTGYRRCRDAPAVAHRPDAQPGAVVAASFLVKHPLIDWRGRKMVLGHAGRCRPRQQPRQLAMGRRLRRRCRTLFPRVQPDPAGEKLDPDGAYVRR